MKKGTVFAALLAVLMLPLAGPAAAENHEETEVAQPIIWVSFLKSQPGKSQDLIQSIIEEDGPLWKQLLADGKIYEWGIAQPITHRGDDDHNVIEWATFADWGAVDAFVSGFLAKQAAKSAEEKATTQEAYMSAVVAGSHYDHVHQSIHGASNGDRPGYIRIGFHKARQGKAASLTEMWQANARPVYEQLMADGAIQGFGLFTQALHGDHRWTHGAWVTMEGLAATTALNAAFDAAMDPETMKSFLETIDPEAHWDEVLAVVHYENPGSE